MSARDEDLEPERLAKLVSERLRLLGQPVRIRILRTLAEGELNVGRLADRLGVTQQNASHHLGLLHRAGLISRRSEGREVLYRTTSDVALSLLDQVAGWAAPGAVGENGPPPPVQR